MRDGLVINNHCITVNTLLMTVVLLDIPRGQGRTDDENQDSGDFCVPVDNVVCWNIRQNRLGLSRNKSGLTATLLAIRFVPP